jgi:exopolyphosphatase/guanosine-5'-triphosphate,3'-diphosphate pyrophosphatase
MESGTRVPRSTTLSRQPPDSWRSSGFAFDLPPTAAAIVTGGTTVTARAVLGAAAGKTLEQTSPRLALADLRALLDHIANADLAARRAMPGMPFGRADVFPTALATIVALAEAAGFSVFQTSLHNLRWGVADEALNQ